MPTYRISIFKTPTIRLYKVDGKRRTMLAEVGGKKAELAQKILLNNLPLKENKRFRYGLVILEADEETAIRIMTGLRAIIGMRNWDLIPKMLEAVAAMDRGEVYWWHSLYLRLGDRAIRAVRSAYL
jgi:hypothetical protein